MDRHQRMGRYAAVAAVSAGTVGSVASADVVITTVDSHPAGSFSIDLTETSNATNDWSIRMAWSTWSTGIVNMSLNAAGTDKWGKEVRLFGEPLLPGDTFGGAGLYGNTGWYQGFGPLLPSDLVGTGYLGFRVGGEGYTYGWIEFEKQMSGLTVTRWGIEEDAATTITLPSQGGGGGAVPGLGGIAALACGAAGVRRSRQRVA